MWVGLVRQYGANEPLGFDLSTRWPAIDVYELFTRVLTTEYRCAGSNIRGGIEALR